MVQTSQRVLGTVVALRRYPVKSMIGEDLDRTEVADSGLLGDRAYALVDGLDGKIATAKNPRKWPTLFDFHAALTENPKTGAPLPPVAITLPDGTTVTNERPDVDRMLSTALGRDVTLARARPRAHTAEAYWPDIEALPHRDTVTDFELPAGTFFDSALVHLLTTATLARLWELHPAGRFSIERFRPNVVIEPRDDEAGFTEDGWIGRDIAIGNSVRLRIDAPCGRCVMTTLAQGDLPQDRGILRTAAQHHRAKVGAYASVVRRGPIRLGDHVTFA